MTKKVVFQGELGAYSHQACINYLTKQEIAEFDIIPKPTFEQAFKAVESGFAELAVIPIENSKAGRVTDVHNLLENTDLKIIDELFLPVKHNLWGIEGSDIKDVTSALSHPQALMQTDEFLTTYNIKPQNFHDTAGACLHIKELNDKSLAGIGSKTAGELYDLELLAENIADDPNNTTRFVIFSRKDVHDPIKENCLTSILFEVKNKPAALYNLLDIFAKESINIIRLESYMNNGSFKNSTFYAELDCNAAKQLENSQNKLEELTSKFKIIGIYPKDDFR
ncbi:MAG TPA: prephenate dehydratase [Alphaproteobacteria bacterium]|nr:prephenate dehydratase [Alphaproteobacteria bacterium]